VQTIEKTKQKFYDSLLLNQNRGNKQPSTVLSIRFLQNSISQINSSNEQQLLQDILYTIAKELEVNKEVVEPHFKQRDQFSTGEVTDNEFNDILNNYLRL